MAKRKVTYRKGQGVSVRPAAKSVNKGRARSGAKHWSIGWDGVSQTPEVQMKMVAGFLLFCAGQPRPVPVRRNAPNLQGAEARFGGMNNANESIDLIGSHPVLWGWDLAETMAYMRAIVRAGPVPVVDQDGRPTGFSEIPLPKELLPFSDMLADLDSMPEWLAAAFERLPTTSEKLAAASEVGWFEGGWEAMGGVVKAFTGGLVAPMDEGGVEDVIYNAAAAAAETAADVASDVVSGLVPGL